MGIKSFFQFLPEIWVSLAFLQLGTWMVFILYAFNMKPDFYNITTVGPQVLACCGAVITGALLTLLRMWKGRIVFIHFWLILIGSGIFFVVAILSVVESEDGAVYASAIMMGGFCHGMIYVAGLSYVHVRAGDFRVQRIAFIHFVYLFAVATTAHSVHGYNKDYVVPREDGLWEFANRPIAYHLFAFSSVTILVTIIHLLLQGRLYNYKTLLDNKLSVANGKFDNFKSTLAMPVIQAVAPSANMWNQLKLTKVMLTSKLTGGLVFNNLLIGLVFFSQRELFTNADDEFSFIVHYITMVGLLFGFGASFFIPMKWIFIPSTIFHCILLVIALSLYTAGSYIAAAVFMWLFYIIIGVCYFVPDAGLMEVAPLAYYDTILSIGYCFEAVPLMIATYLINQTYPVSSGSLWINGSITMVGLILAAVGMIFWYPNTQGDRIIEIQYMLLYPSKVIHVRNPNPAPQQEVTVDLDPSPRPPLPYPNVNNPPSSPTHVIPVPPPLGPPPLPYPEVQGGGAQEIQSGGASNGSALYPRPEGAAVIEHTDTTGK